MPDHVMVLAGDFAYAVFAWILIFQFSRYGGWCSDFILFICILLNDAVRTSVYM